MSLASYFSRKSFLLYVIEYHPQQADYWEKTLKMLTTRCLGSTLLVGPSLEMPAQAEEEAGWLTCCLGHPAPKAPRWVPASAAVVQKASSGAQEGGFRPLSQAWPHLPNAWVHPELQVRSTSFFSGTTTLNVLCISYRIYP